MFGLWGGGVLDCGAVGSHPPEKGVLSCGICHTAKELQPEHQGDNYSQTEQAESL